MLNVLKKLLLASAIAGCLAGPCAAGSVELNEVPCWAYRFTGGNFERSHWSAILPASNGKVYVGVSTHGDSAYVYEFAPARRP